MSHEWSIQQNYPRRVLVGLAVLLASACMPDLDSLAAGSRGCDDASCAGSGLALGGSGGKATTSDAGSENSGDVAGSAGSDSSDSGAAGAATIGEVGGSAGSAGANGRGGQGGRGGSGGSASDGGAGAATGGPAALTDGWLPATATADSEETAYGNMNIAARAVDGRTDTRWTAADKFVGHYLTLDLGAPHSLSRAEVMWEAPAQAGNGIYQYTVSVSADDIDYEIAVDKRENTETTQVQVVAFPQPTTARFVRITVTGLPTPLYAEVWAAIFEFRVHEADSEEALGSNPR